LDAIKNFSLRLEGKPTEVEYHPAIMKMCCNMFMKSPSAYINFQKKSIIPMPSETTIKKKIKEGDKRLVYDGKCTGR
jgi:hypothetical protein